MTYQATAGAALGDGPVFLRRFNKTFMCAYLHTTFL